VKNSRNLKIGYYVIEGMNSFGTVYYAYYLFFFMQHQFGFDNKKNLMLSAAYGAIYTVGAWLGGRFGQRFGFFNALKIGCVVMAGALLIGTRLHTAIGQVGAMAGMVMGMCLTWPSLQALVSEGETPVGLPRCVGIYNLVWAGTAAVSFFIGGTMLDKLGPQSIFYVPASIFILELGLLFYLESRARQPEAPRGTPGGREGLLAVEAEVPQLNPRPIARARLFLRMAWLANPFAYIAINALVAFVPGLATKFGLSAMVAGFVCSVWCFARLAAFFVLRMWPGWHYRFRWLLLAYIALIVSFVSILAAPNLFVLVLMQILLGGALGLIYYSSLFYSMETTEKKGEHGGIHEAAIGLGNFAGPAMGAASLHFLPNHANSGAMGVGLMLVAGLLGLLAVRRFGN
jgi:MFS family permease